ncbi:ABC transporter permease [Rhizosaccharibacter radicis]|uniref:Autoinducer 2 import system permease protein LsrC n=1 Tax=Rhizosaccharibacter radicis TaxID=2782605 RepID=A0ABT1VVN0_9PROT|nr:ABC transporter permease [Acetobacteraceae bacterium KSS12]
MSAHPASGIGLAVRHKLLPILAFVIFALMFGLYLLLQPHGIQTSVLVTASNKGALLALVAMAQTLPVLTGGIDLSVGAIVVLANCLASNLVNGTPAQIGLGVLAVLGTGVLAGAVNAMAVVVGRLQPIVATLATSTMFYGVSLLLRPSPGGEVDDDFASALTGDVWGVPVSLLLLIAVLGLLWWPFSRSVTGRGLFAVGSSDASAFMSGVPVGRARASAYLGAGLLAGMAGLLLTLIAESAQASAVQAGDFTLNSIAAVVIGGTSLFGGSGGLVGSVFGAFILRTIGDLLFVSAASPLWQPLFQGLILLGAVSLGALPLLRVRNRLELFR